MDKQVFFSFLLWKWKRSAVHAKPFAGRIRSIVKDMAQMSFALEQIKNVKVKNKN